LATVARNAVHGALGVPFAVLLDVLLCQDLRDDQQRGILEIVRDVL
jgi:hypothetical protein